MWLFRVVIKINIGNRSVLKSGLIAIFLNHFLRSVSKELDKLHAFLLFYAIGSYFGDVATEYPAPECPGAQAAWH